MIVKQLTDYHLQFLSLKEGCRGSSKSTHVKMPHCWNSHALAYFVLIGDTIEVNVMHVYNGCFNISMMDDDYTFTLTQTICALPEDQMTLLFNGQLLIQADKGSLFEIEFIQRRYGKDLIRI